MIFEVKANTEFSVPSMPEDVELASRGRRLAARMIDLLIIAAVTYLLSFALVRSGLGMPVYERSPVVWQSEIAGVEFQRREFRWNDALWSIQTPVDALGALLYISTFALLNFRLLARRGQTVGKAMVGIKIVTYDTNAKPPLSVLLGLREGSIFLLGFVFGYLGTTLGLVNVLWIFAASRRCGHDYWSNTKVVRVRHER